jgi:RIP metalloprotease RseP
MDTGVDIVALRNAGCSIAFTGTALLIALPFVLFIHELGHYLAARLFGVRVESFRIGFGRILKSRTDRHGTLWTLHMLPFGGMVGLSGTQRVAQGIPAHEAFCSKSVWQRLAIVATGPFASFALVFVLFFFFFATAGQPATPPILTGIEIGAPADRAGLQVGDRVLAVDGKRVRSYQQVSRATLPKIGGTLKLTIQRDDQILNKQVSVILTEYRSKRGAYYSHGRIGVQTLQVPLMLKAIKSVNGVDTNDDIDLARALVTAQLGKDVLLGLDSTDQKTHIYKIHLDSDLNRNLNTPNTKDYKRVFLGTFKGNVFQPLTLGNSLSEAGRETVRISKSFVDVMGSLWSASSYKLAPETNVMSDIAPVKSVIYRGLYIAALLSVIVGFMNLIPLPYTDGGVMLPLIAEAFVGRTKAEANRARLLVGSLVGLYLIFLSANIQDVLAR